MLPQMVDNQRRIVPEEEKKEEEVNQGEDQLLLEQPTINAAKVILALWHLAGHTHTTFA
jgi:hypothetical protein